MNRDQLLAIGERLVQAQTLVILPHLNADGDALGAAFALGLALETLGKKVDVLLEEDVPAMLDFLPGSHLVRPEPRAHYDLAVNIDNGDVARLGRRSTLFLHAPARVSLDHHATNKVEADLSYVDTHAAATGEIIFDLVELMGVPMSRNIALCLYTAILTDTGGFRFTNTTARTHAIAASLMAHGIDHAYIAKRVFDTISWPKMLLMKQAMNRMTLYGEGRLAVSWLDADDIHSAGNKSEDFEGLVNLGRNLEGVEVSLFIREDEPHSFKGSLRSNNYVNVAEIAESMGGGGHKRASGFNCEGDLQEVVQDMIARILPHLEPLRDRKV